MNFTPTALLSATLASLAVSPADQIGINFGATGNGNTGLAASTTAGVVPQENWNNAAGPNGSLASLVDDTGNATGASVTWMSDEEWSSGSGSSGDAALLRGWISENSGASSSIAITGIPYTGYDLYIYTHHDRTSEDSVIGEADGAFPDFTLVETDNDGGGNESLNTVVFTRQTTSGGPEGNYAVFTGLTQETLNLTLSVGEGDRAPVNGIQIVGVVAGAPPVVRNLAARGLVATAATLGAEVTDPGGETPSVTIYYGDSDAGENAAAWDAQLNLGRQGGEAFADATGLAPVSTYFYRAFASNSAGNAWASSSSSFTTPEVGLPAVANGIATVGNGTFAILASEVTDTGGDPPSVDIYYGTSDGGTTAGSWESSVSGGVQSGSFVVPVAGLEPTTVYYFRAFARNSGGGVWAPVSSSFTTLEFVPPTLVINEIHYDEDDKTVRSEFVELFNPGDSALDLGGYTFSSGIDYTFPPGAFVAAGGYVVVAEDPATLLEQYGYSGSFGPFAAGSSLRNSGDRVVLRDPSGAEVDEVDYKLGFPWPTVGEGLGSPGVSPSAELLNPLLDNNLGGSWRASGFPVGGPSGEGGEPVTLVAPAEADWSYLPGIQYPASDGGGKEWWDNGYDEAAAGSWLQGGTGIGYGDDDDVTILTGMEGSYSSVFLRREFTLPSGDIPELLALDCYHDDGAVVYINGTEVARFSLDAGPVPFPPTPGFANDHEAAWSSAILTGASRYLVAGTNVIAVQCINTNISSSDLSIDVSLATAPDLAGEGHGPTPGVRNSVYSIAAPPQVRQVGHAPDEPSPGEAVVVSAKITDPEGVGDVFLSYQTVDPGDYFCRYLKFSDSGSANPDPRFEDPGNWISIPMHDDGAGGDNLAGDGVFSVSVPSLIQENRRLVRYRITAVDAVGSGVTVPYSDDPQPNFAYFVYGGTPAWSGSVQGGGARTEFPGDLMSSVPTYFLLSTSDWVNDSQFGGYRGSEYLWPGTMIYEGKVYDHIAYRPRGGVHRYQYGKNFWKFDFNRGHRFKARDRYGERYETEWDKLNFSSIVQQVGFGHRGEQGLFEGVGFRLFELCGVPACKTHYTQFYVIDEVSPTGGNQYEGDYYGLFLAIEQMDSRYLDQHGLPDGNLYKIEGHSGDSNNQGADEVSDGSDVSAFISGYRGNSPSAAWWEENFDVENYLSYRSVVEAIHHYDIAGGKNYFYFNNPETGKFQVLPWDLDLTWADNMYGSGNHDFKSKVAANPAFRTRYRNRIREMIDLIFNADEGFRLIDETVRHVWNPGELSLVDADRRLWDNNPRLNSRGRYYEIASDNSFGGMVQVLKDYVVSRGSWMEQNLLPDESDIPSTPEISYVGAAGFPADGLQFASSPATGLEAIEWRVSEIYHPGITGYLDGEPYRYEIEDGFSSGEQSTVSPEYTFPGSVARPGRTYRARVRHKDSAGRFSHWSAPVEFVAAAPDVSAYVAALRISEIHYHPRPADPAELAAGWEEGDFEFIELQNTGSDVVDLTGLRFTKGVDFDFPEGLSVAPGAFLVFVKNQGAFESRYGIGIPIAGEWDPSDRLANGGETLKLSIGAGTPIIEFEFGDDPPWPTPPDGGGFSLTLRRPSETLPGDHALAASWRPSSTAGGTPGRADEGGFQGWIEGFDVGVETAPSADPDFDGIANLLEYALFSDPSVPSGSALPSGSILDIPEAGGEYLTLSFLRPADAEDIVYTVEYSESLGEWQSGSAVRVSATPQGDGSVLDVWRVAQNSNPGGVERRFMRLQVTLGVSD